MTSAKTIGTLRGEVERYRVNDAVGNRGDVDLMSLNLVCKLGRPAARAGSAQAGRVFRFQANPQCFLELSWRPLEAASC